MVVETVPSIFKDIIRNIAFGDLGVRFFFVISGFLITFLLIREKEKKGEIDFKAFYIRRFLRIFPVFYFYLFAVAIYCYIFGIDINNSLFISSGLYIQNFAPFGSNWLIAHTWSLAVEEQFYILWPLLFKKLQNKKLLFILLLILFIGMIMRIINYKYPDLSPFFLAPFLIHADFLFSGCFLAFIISYNPSFIYKRILKANTIVVVISIFLIWFFSKYEFHPEYDILMIPVSGTIINLNICFLLIYFILKKETVGFKLLNKSYIVFIGKLSYSLYLWQQMFLVPAYHSSAKFWWTTFPYNIFFIFGAALLSYNLVEKPFLKLKARFKV